MQEAGSEHCGGEGGYVEQQQKLLAGRAGVRSEGSSVYGDDWLEDVGGGWRSRPALLQASCT